MADLTAVAGSDSGVTVSSGRVRQLQPPEGGHTASVRFSLRVNNDSRGNDRIDCGNSQNRFGFVICFSSNDTAAASAISPTCLVINLLSGHGETPTKGNIIPLVEPAEQHDGVFSGAQDSATTVITGQTKPFVIRFSSAPKSVCYQKETLLPVETSPYGINS